MRVSEEAYPSLRIMPSALAETQEELPFVVIVRNRAEFFRWLRKPPRALRWLQVEGMLADSEAWAEAAHNASHVPLDVMLFDPASEFSDLYRLVDVCAAREVRVTVPAAPGLAKVVRLAAALRLPIRVLPGQPAAEALEELHDALEFYLHEPMVETPVEFFHSLLAAMSGGDANSLWMILEEDAEAFQLFDADGQPRLPRAADSDKVMTASAAFVETHLNRLIAEGAECATCPWQQQCRGYFKWPDPLYSCEGIKQLFSSIQVAGNEIRKELADIATADAESISSPGGDAI
ncbi:MAG: hypothetical protein JO025_13130 [Verrucomicrobia bacterium]|nr:hypothetical protein [Verrucomicrobiota bacterium]